METKIAYNKALQSDKIAGYAANFAAERERYVPVHFDTLLSKIALWKKPIQQ